MSSPLGTLAELRSALDAGTASSQDLVAQALERADAHQNALNCFVGLRADAAREEADEIAEKLLAMAGGR